MLLNKIIKGYEYMYSSSCNKPYNKMVSVKQPEPVKALEPVKILQVPVIKGFGEKEELVVSQLTIAPPNPPVFRIVSIDKEVTVTNFKLASVCAPEEDGGYWKAKVIIDG